MKGTPTLHAIAGAAALLMTAVPAPAQNALGDGRALDNNLRRGSGGRNQGQSALEFRREVMFRNAIVTGNAAGGRSFRGEIGYTAADDFRGLAGSDSFYQFQRDSFYSSIATQNLSGIASLQNSLAYTIGGQSANSLAGPLIVRRDGAGASVRSSVASLADFDGAAPDGQVDLFNSVSGVLRAPSLDLIRGASRPDLLAYTQDEDTGEAKLLSSSSLLGIKLLPSENVVFSSPGDIPNAQAAFDPFTGARTDGAEAEAETDAPAAENRVTAHARVLEQLGSRNLSNPLNDPLNRRADQQTFERPRSSVELPDPEDEDTEEEAEDDPAFEADAPELVEQDDDDPVRARLEELRLRLNDFGLRAPELDEDGQEIEQRTVTEIARELLTGDAINVDTFIEGASLDTVFARHVRRGQEFLAEEEWFYAEERFTAALGIRPGEPMAIIGRVSAQVGAGMFLSGALNLRNLYRAYPEFIAVTIDDAFLPGPERQQELVDQLRFRATRATAIGRDAAFLLAFLGRQADDGALVREGLDRADAIASEMGTPPDALDEALRAVWLDPAE